MTRLHSPNANGRNPSVPLRYIVVHYTGMESAQAALDRMMDAKAEVSAHYMIDEDGAVTQLVDEDKRAWHAGKSYWHGVTDMNSASIGIELANPGHEFGYRPFPKAQIDALIPLLREIITRHWMEAKTCLVGHSDIALCRKQDPGELFPWQELAEQGLGVWPQPVESDYSPASDQDVQTMLRQLGYNCPDNAVDMREALLGFQRRFNPSTLTGMPERETIARLRALVRQVA